MKLEPMIQSNGKFYEIKDDPGFHNCDKCNLRSSKCGNKRFNCIELLQSNNIDTFYGYFKEVKPEVIFGYLFFDDAVLKINKTGDCLSCYFYDNYTMTCINTMFDCSQFLTNEDVGYYTRPFNLEI